MKIKLFSALPEELDPKQSEGASVSKGLMIKSFIKYQSLGNDFILLDFWKKTKNEFTKLIIHKNWQSFVIKSCHRHFGVGADGVLIITPNNELLIFNADGSQAEICLNGLRCATYYLFEKYNLDKKFNIKMGGKTIECQIDKSNVINKINISSKIEKKTVSIKDLKVKGHYLQIPNPHFIIQKKITQKDLLNFGKLIENNQEFENKTNVEFIYQNGASSYNMLVHERGVGPTLACSSGATAVVKLLFDTKQIKQNQKIKINMPGGTLICWIDKNKKINLQAKAQQVFTGTLQQIF